MSRMTVNASAASTRADENIPFRRSLIKPISRSSPLTTIFNTLRSSSSACGSTFSASLVVSSIPISRSVPKATNRPVREKKQRLRTAFGRAVRLRTVPFAASSRTISPLWMSIPVPIATVVPSGLNAARCSVCPSFAAKLHRGVPVAGSSSCASLGS